MSSTLSIGSRASFSRCPRLGALAAAAAFGAPVGVAQQCAPLWAPGFNAARFSAEPLAFITFDDGSGPALYAGGRFTLTGDLTTRAVARRRGEKWESAGRLTCVSNPNPCAEVRKFAIFDSGSGPTLYACGVFAFADGSPTPSIAKWNGQRWTPLPDVFTRQAEPMEFNDMVVFDDGSGPALFVAGEMLTVSGSPFVRVAKWTGTHWLPTPGNIPFPATPGPSNGVQSLAVFDDGAGQRLYAVAYVNQGGSTWWVRLYRLEGSQWALVPNAPTMGDTQVELDAIETGPARGLYLSGYYTAHRFWRYDGAAWTVPPTCDNLLARQVEIVHSDPPQLAIARATQFSGVQMELWDGLARTQIGPPTPEPIDFSGLHVRATELGPEIVIGWDAPMSPRVSGVAALAPGATTWAQLGDGLAYPPVAAARFDDGAGPAIYTLGHRVPGVGLVHRLRDGEWASLPPLTAPGGNSPTATPRRLVTLPTPAGPRLHALGSFDFAGQGPPSTPNALLACLEGASWSPIGRVAGVSVASCATMFDSGAGSELIVAGDFASIEGVAVNRIARRTATGWSPLGYGLNGAVTDAAVFDGGSGPHLYVCGRFTVAGQSEALGLARWDGQSWSPVAGFAAAHNLGDDAVRLAIGRFHGTLNLYVGGSNMKVNDANFGAIARFDGAAWYSLNVGGTITFLQAVGDGTTQTIVTSRVQVFPSSTNLGAVSFWDGAHWSGLRLSQYAAATDVAIDETEKDGRIPVWIVGSFNQGGPEWATNIARVDLCSLSCDVDTNGDRVVDILDLNQILSRFGQATPTGYSSATPADLNGDGFINFADLNILLSAFGQAC